MKAPPTFKGVPGDLGTPADDWLYSLRIYLETIQSPDTQTALSFLEKDAIRWWRDVEESRERQDPTRRARDMPFEEFAALFRGRWVDAHRGREARERIEGFQLKLHEEDVERGYQRFREDVRTLRVEMDAETGLLRMPISQVYVARCKI